MAQVIFEYNGANTIIQCNINDSMEIIIQKFIQKLNKNFPVELYFLYDGKILNKKLSFKEVANKEDIAKERMIILVNEKNPDDDKYYLK